MPRHWTTAQAEPSLTRSLALAAQGTASIDDPTAGRLRRHRRPTCLPAKPRGGLVMNHKLLALYGLKFNPFSPELPVDAIYVPPKIESFCWRIEHAQIREGGFAMVHGDPGSGKSIVLRLLADRMRRLPDVTVGRSEERRV